jgi:hypothetical protein
MASSLKQRMITKNNFGMPYSSNPRFMPVNKKEASKTVQREVRHYTECEPRRDLKGVKDLLRKN